jgi:hypothetical protein
VTLRPSSVLSLVKEADHVLRPEIAGVLYQSSEISCLAEHGGWFYA